MRINTNLQTAENMEKELKKHGLKEPTNILKDAINSRTSILIPELKATLHWIYNGNKEWSFFESNTTDINDYLFQLMV